MSAPTIPGIPTTYRGVNFRSRLEARWACMFDLLEWPWEYEPLELAGYIPDFIVRFNRPLLVEVKPALTFAEMHEPARKVGLSGWNGDALVVGAVIRELDDPFYMAFGRFHDSSWGRPILEADERRHGWSPAVLQQCHCGPRIAALLEHCWPWAGESYDVGGEPRMPSCLSCGRDAAEEVGNDGGPWRGLNTDLWTEAGNRTQWNPRRRP